MITNNFASEIAEIHLVVSDLAREIRELRHEKEGSHQIGSQENRTRMQSPTPSSTRARKTLGPMNNEYKKAFRVSYKYLNLSIFNLI